MFSDKNNHHSNVRRNLFDVKKVWMLELILGKCQQVFKILICWIRIRIRPKLDRIRNPVPVPMCVGLVGTGTSSSTQEKYNFNSNLWKFALKSWIAESLKRFHNEFLKFSFNQVWFSQLFRCLIFSGKRGKFNISLLVCK